MPYKDNYTFSVITIILNLKGEVSPSNKYKIRILKNSPKTTVITKSTSGTQLFSDNSHSFTTQRNILKTNLNFRFRGVISFCGLCTIAKY